MKRWFSDIIANLLVAGVVDITIAADYVLVGAF